MQSLISETLIKDLESRALPFWAQAFPTGYIDPKPYLVLALDLENQDLLVQIENQGLYLGPSMDCPCPNQALYHFYKSPEGNMAVRALQSHLFQAMDTCYLEPLGDRLNLQAWKAWADKIVQNYPKPEQFLARLELFGLGDLDLISWGIGALWDPNRRAKLESRLE